MKTDPHIEIDYGYRWAKMGANTWVVFDRDGTVVGQFSSEHDARGGEAAMNQLRHEERVRTLNAPAIIGQKAA